MPKKNKKLTHREKLLQQKRWEEFQQKENMGPEDDDANEDAREEAEKITREREEAERAARELEEEIERARIAKYKAVNFHPDFKDIKRDIPLCDMPRSVGMYSRRMVRKVEATHKAGKVDDNSDLTTRSERAWMATMKVPKRVLREDKELEAHITALKKKLDVGLVHVRDLEEQVKNYAELYGRCEHDFQVASVEYTTELEAADNCWETAVLNLKQLSKQQIRSMKQHQQSILVQKVLAAAAFILSMDMDEMVGPAHLEGLVDKMTSYERQNACWTASGCHLKPCVALEDTRRESCHDLMVKGLEDLDADSRVFVDYVSMREISAFGACIAEWVTAVLRHAKAFSPLTKTRVQANNVRDLLNQKQVKLNEAQGAIYDVQKELYELQEKPISSENEFERPRLRKKIYLVFIMGPRGSGKAEQCQYISAEFGFVHLDVQNLLQNAALSEEHGETLKKHMKYGTDIVDMNSVPLELIFEMIRKAINRSGNHRFILTGFPSNLEQVTRFESEVGAAKFALLMQPEKATTIEEVTVARGADIYRKSAVEVENKNYTAEFLASHSSVIDYFNVRGRLNSVFTNDDPALMYKEVRRFFVPEIVFVTGRPGAMKSGQCAKVVDEFGWTHISTSKLIQEALTKADNKTRRLIEDYVKNGKLVSTELLMPLFQAAIRQSGSKRFIIDGFPKTVDQCVAFENQIAECRFMIYLDTPEFALKHREDNELRKIGLKKARTEKDLEMSLDEMVAANPELYRVAEAYQAKRKIFSDQTNALLEYVEKRGKLKRVTEHVTEYRIDQKSGKVYHMQDAPPGCVPVPNKMGTDQSRTYAEVRKPFRPFIVGVLGSSQNTVAEYSTSLVAKYGFISISVPTLLINETETNSRVGQIIRQHQKRGMPIPPEIVLPLVTSAMKFAESSRVLLEGFPDSLPSLFEFEKQMTESHAPRRQLAPSLHTVVDQILFVDGGDGGPPNPYEQEVADYYLRRGMLTTINLRYDTQATIARNLVDLFQPSVTFLVGDVTPAITNAMRRVQDEVGVLLLNSQELISMEVNSGSSWGTWVHGLLQHGKEIPTKVPIALMAKSMRKSPYKKFVIAGFPRTLEQLAMFEKLVVSPDKMLFVTSGSDSRPATPNGDLAAVMTHFMDLGKLKKVNSVDDEELMYERLYEALVPQIFFLKGGPGSGKRTIAMQLSNDFGLRTLDTRIMLDAELSSGSRFANMVQDMISSGQEVPTNVTVALVKRAIEACNASGYILIGSPANLHDADLYEKMVTNNDIPDYPEGPRVGVKLKIGGSGRVLVNLFEKYKNEDIVKTMPRRFRSSVVHLTCNRDHLYDRNVPATGHRLEIEAAEDQFEQGWNEYLAEVQRLIVPYEREGRAHIADAAQHLDELYRELSQLFRLILSPTQNSVRTARTLRELFLVREGNQIRLASIPGYLGSCLGRKFVDGKRTEVPAIIVFVEKKMKSKTDVPGGFTMAVPDELEALVDETIIMCKTDVVEGKAPLEAKVPGPEFLELRSGTIGLTGGVRLVSKDHRKNIIGGTLTCPVTYDDGRVGLITNDYVTGPAGRPIYHPEMEPKYKVGITLRGGLYASFQEFHPGLLAEREGVYTIDAGLISVGSNYMESIHAGCHNLGRLGDPVRVSNKISLEPPTNYNNTEHSPRTKRASEKFVGDNVSARPASINDDDMDIIGQEVMSVGAGTGYTFGTVEGYLYEFTDKDSGQTVFTDILIKSTEPTTRFADAGDGGKLILLKNSLRPLAISWGGRQGKYRKSHEQKVFSYGILMTSVLGFLRARTLSNIDR